MIYEEIKDDIGYFVKLYKLSKAKGMSIQHVIDVLEIANNDLPSIEERLKRLRNDVSMLQSQKHTCRRNLYQLNNQIATTSTLLNSLRITCERERRAIENLCNEKIRLEVLIIEFKNNNEEYLKIKQAAEEIVKSVLTNSKLLLRFATASVIESLRRNSELYNDFLLYNNSATSNESNYLSFIPGQQDQQFSDIGDDIYTALILEESEKLYNELTTKLTNWSYRSNCNY
jgi:chromosome segregation ATPase